jgi:phosphopantothenoylcysteine decarboxylase/phosphopantothenate--cysteine ligase
VTVVMTTSAQRFVTPLTFETLSQRAVHTDMWHAPQDFKPTHISLAEWADLVLVVPATANIIGKMANGIADDLLSTLLLTNDAPIALAPAMNTRMWENRVVQENVRHVAEMGCRIIEPGEGYLACGAVGKGRLADVSDIIDTVASLLA